MLTYKVSELSNPFIIFYVFLQEVFKLLPSQHTSHCVGGTSNMMRYAAMTKATRKREFFIGWAKTGLSVFSESGHFQEDSQVLLKYAANLLSTVCAKVNFWGEKHVKILVFWVKDRFLFRGCQWGTPVTSVDTCMTKAKVFKLYPVRIFPHEEKNTPIPCKDLPLLRKKPPLNRIYSALLSSNFIPKQNLVKVNTINSSLFYLE